MRDGERKRFQLQYPKDQLLLKTDVSKYELTFECRPDLVSQGAQKAFLAFADKISDRWEKDAKQLGEGYFKDLVSKAIVFRWTDGMIGASEWYRGDRGYKAQIVTYTVAWVVNQVRRELELEIDLRRIWTCQSVRKLLRKPLSAAAPLVAAVIKDAPEAVRNISEYAKHQGCWRAVQDEVQMALPAEIGNCLIDRGDTKQIRKDDRSITKIVDEIELDILLLKLSPYLDDIRKAADRNRLLSPTGDRAMNKLSSGRVNLTKSEKKVMREMLLKLDEAGVELPEP